MSKCTPKIIIPLRVTSSGAKALVGPYVRVDPSYHLMLNLVVPDPFTARWELHVVSDPNVKLKGDRGIAAVEGPKSLVKHECLTSILGEAPTFKLKGKLYIAPWGLPIVIADRVFEVPEEARTVLVEYGLSSAERILEYLAEHIVIEKV